MTHTPEHSIRTESALDDVTDPREAPPLRWGIIAPGGIGHTFTRSAHRHTQSRVVAVGSRDADRARAFADEHDIPNSHGDYAALVADEEVEAVYVASPHSHHLEHALLAIEAGKPVLVEKAFTRNRAEAVTLLEAAERAGVFCMEAMWTRHLPHMVALRSRVARGLVGDVLLAAADHGQNFPFDPSHRLYDPELAGGALLDLGVYPLGFLLDVLGAPHSITAAGSRTETGVDGLATVSLGYPDRRHGLAHTTLWAGTPCTALVAGTAGRIEVEGNFLAPSSFTLLPADGEPVRVEGRVDDGMQYQIAEAARRITAGERQSPVMSWQHTLDLMAVLDDVREQLGVVFPGE